MNFYQNCNCYRLLFGLKSKYVFRLYTSHVYKLINVCVINPYPVNVENMVSS